MKTDELRCPILWLLLPLIAGYAGAEHLIPVFPRTFSLAGSVLAVSAVVLARRVPAAEIAWACCYCAGAFFLAAAYYEHRKGYLESWENLPPREAELEFDVERPFASPIEDRISGLGRVKTAPDHLSELEGKRIHFTFPAPASESPTVRTARLRTRGVLEVIDPKNAAEGFENYLLRSGVQFRFGRGPPPETTRPPNPFFQICRNNRDLLEARLRHGAEEDMRTARVYTAMLLGQRQALETDQRDAFMQTGTFHLFAISGLHIGVIAFALYRILAALRVPPVPAAGVGLLILLVYVETTGGSPSAVRAFIMVAFFWAARLFERPANPLAALACSAVCVLALFPHQLWSAGFQLSYTVVTTILLLGLPLAEHWKPSLRPFRHVPEDALRRHQRAANQALDAAAVTVAVSLSATLASSPLTIHYFNVFAPGAVLLNAVLVPLASLVISAGVLSLFFGLAGLLPVSALFNHAAWLIIAVMEALVGLWRVLPGHFWHAEYRAGFLVGPSVVAMLAAVIACASYRERSLWLNRVAPFAIFVLLLLIGVRLTFFE